uniref:N-acyl-aliphatic-L-amino acid amidohydrolase n=1 Tax=Rhabditophanes sp. KR3021 TaxID=114890 RepID=A0AC35TJ74_9BILA
MSTTLEDEIALKNFQDYLRIETVHPKPDYYKCRDFLFGLAKELNWQHWEFEVAAGKPFVGFTIEGRNPSLESLMLYSHTDVVPVENPQKWTYPPFSAHNDGKTIFGRGTQDMKCVGIQYVEALRRLKSRGVNQFERTIHIVFGPDEEIGGNDGMKRFIETEFYKKMNIGFALDEGLATEGETFIVYYAERCPWWVKFICKGSSGHGSRFIENTAIAKFQFILNKALEYRSSQENKLKCNPEFTIGNVTSLNCTKVDGGFQINCVPETFELNMDIRVTPTEDLEMLEQMLYSWAAEAGNGSDVEIDFIQKSLPTGKPTFDRNNIFVNAFASSLENNGCPFKLEIFTGFY